MVNNTNVVGTPREVSRNGHTGGLFLPRAQEVVTPVPDPKLTTVTVTPTVLAQSEKPTTKANSATKTEKLLQLTSDDQVEITKILEYINEKTGTGIKATAYSHLKGSYGEIERIKFNDQDAVVIFIPEQIYKIFESKLQTLTLDFLTKLKTQHQPLLFDFGERKQGTFKPLTINKQEISFSNFSETTKNNPTSGAYLVLTKAPTNLRAETPFYFVPTELFNKLILEIDTDKSNQ